MVKKIFFGIVLLFATQISQAQLFTAIDIVPGARGSSPVGLTIYSNHLFMLTEAASNNYLYQYDTTSGLRVITDSTDGSSFRNCAVYKGKLYFPGMNSLNGNLSALAYDGVNTPTILHDTTHVAWGQHISPHDFTVCGNRLYYMANTAAFGEQIFWYNGVDTLLQVPFVVRPSGSIYPVGKAVFNNKLNLSGNLANTSQYDNFVVDPATNSISTVAAMQDLMNGTGVVVNNKLYYSGYTQLSSFDAAGNYTKLTGLSVNHIQYITSEIYYYGNSFYFCATTDTSANLYLYSYDVSSGTTKSITRLYSNSQLPSIIGLSGAIVHNNALYFSADIGDGHGWEVYKYDGSAVSLVADVDPAGSSIPRELITYNGGLYMVATTPATGFELFRISGGGGGSGGGVGVQNVAWNGGVSLSPNPVAANASFSITLQQAQQLDIAIISADGKRVYESGPMIFKAGNQTLNIPADKLASGQYVYYVRNTQGHVLASGLLQKQ